MYAVLCGLIVCKTRYKEIGDRKSKVEGEETELGIGSK